MLGFQVVAARVPVLQHFIVSKPGRMKEGSRGQPSLSCTEAAVEARDPSLAW
jgi:hypothetical protein